MLSFSICAGETHHAGALVAHAAEGDDGAVLIASFDLDAVHRARLGWGLFRDRRPELYGRLVAH